MIDRNHATPEPKRIIKHFLQVGVAGLIGLALLFFFLGYLFVSLFSADRSRTVTQPASKSKIEAPQVNQLGPVGSDLTQQPVSSNEQQETDSVASNQNAALPVPETSQPKSVKAATIDDLLLFYPDPFPIGDWEPDNLDPVNVFFDSSDGTRLHGWFLESKNAGPTILFSHGNGGNLSHRTQILTFLHKRLDASVLIYDYRGYGRSEGIPTVAGILEDADAAVAKLAELSQVERQQIILMGRSLGGAVSIQLAAKNSYRALIVESSFSSLQEIARHLAPGELQPYVFLIPKQKLNSVAAIQEHQGPYFQSHGRLDELIPFQMGQSLYQAANQPKTWVTVPNAGHNDSYSDDYLDKLAQFITELPE